MKNAAASGCQFTTCDGGMGLSGGQGTRTPQENTGNSSISDEGGANSGAVLDAAALAVDLARIVVAWPMLPAPIRRAILALLDCEG
jgi:hypothetical protein